jgi:hypothetical protein
MQLSSATHKYPLPATAIACACAAASMCFSLYHGVSDQQGWAKRSATLDAIAGEVSRETCLESADRKPFLIGEVITLDGVPYGTSPTSCVIRSQTGQFAEVAYLNGALTVTNVFSAKEIQSRISIHNNGAK